MWCLVATVANSLIGLITAWKYVYFFLIDVVKFGLTSLQSKLGNVPKILPEVAESSSTTGAGIWNL